MICDNSVNPGQTQSAMFLTTLGCEERVKNPREYLRFNTAPIISDLDTNISASRQPGVAVPRWLGQFYVPGLNCDPAISSNGLNRVLQDLYEHLLHFALV